MIQFINQNVQYNLKNKQQVKKWVMSIVEEGGKKCGEIAFIYCDDEYLLEINVKYLKHKTLTDIVTFDYNENDKISGDIFISIERVGENARKYSTTLSDELGRVMAHGVLHLLGYKDKADEDKAMMKKMEDKYRITFPNVL